jgi:hypothetical protein
MTPLSKKLLASLASCWLGLMPGISAAQDRLAEGFANPPKETAPWCFYYWVSDRISKEGITRDLEAMARVGIGEALIGNIFLDEVKPGNIKVLSEEWWQLIEHAIREGGRVGVDIGLFNCPAGASPAARGSRKRRRCAASRGPKPVSQARKSSPPCCPRRTGSSRMSRFSRFPRRSMMRTPWRRSHPA